MVEESKVTGWIAWVLLGGILLDLLGVMHVAVGLIALLRPEILADTRADRLFPLPLTALAWLQVAVGVFAATTGMALLRGRRWARPAAIVLALLAILVNFAFVDVYPVWSIIAMALACVIAYAVAVHGQEIIEASG